jgi:hypothetical protein
MPEGKDFFTTKAPGHQNSIIRILVSLRLGGGAWFSCGYIH